MSGLNPISRLRRFIPWFVGGLFAAGFAVFLVVLMEPERNSDELFPHERYAISYLGGCSFGSQCGQSLYAFNFGAVRAREFSGDWGIQALGNDRYRISWLETCGKNTGSCGDVLVWDPDGGPSKLTLVDANSLEARTKDWFLIQTGNAVRIAPGSGCRQDGVCGTVVGLEREYFKLNEPDAENAFNNLRLFGESSDEADRAFWAFAPTKMNVADQTSATALLDMTIKAQALTGSFYDQLFIEFHDHSEPVLTTFANAPQFAPSSYFLSFIEESERSISIPLQVRNCDSSPINLQLVRKRNSRAQSPVDYRYSSNNPHILREFAITPSEKPQRSTLFSEFGHYEITLNYQPPSEQPVSRCGALPKLPLGLLFFATALAALSPVFCWSLLNLYRNNSTRRRQATDWASAAFGGSVGLAECENRWRYLGFDIGMVLIAASLFYRQAEGESLFEYSTIINLTAIIGYALYVFFGGFSLILRLFHRRLSPAVLLLNSSVVGLVTAMFIVAIDTSGLDATDRGVIVETILAISTLIIAMIVSLFLVFRYWRNHRPTRRTLWLGLLFLVGGLLCDALFIAILGTQASGQFAFVFPLGDTAAVFAVLLAGILQFRHIENPWAPIVWPIVGFVSGLSLRILSSAATVFGQATGESVSAGVGQVFVALVLGALAVEGLLFAKLIWVDRDPEARKRAIVVRGVFLILHAITPIFLFIFVMVSIFGFTARVGSELGDAGKELKIIQTSIDRIRNEAIAARGRAESQVADVDRQIELLRERLANESAKALEEFDRIYEDSVQAALNSGSAIADDLAREGEAIVTEISSKLKPPPVDLGFFEVPNPFAALGDGIVSALSGLMPNIDFGAIIGQLSERAIDTVTKEFAGPMARAQSIVAGVEALGNDITVEARAQANELTRTASLALNVLNEELESSYKTAGRLMAASFKIVYQIIVLVASILFALMLFLLWRVVNGLIDMRHEIERGMSLIRGTDTIDVSDPPV